MYTSSMCVQSLSNVDEKWLDLDRTQTMYPLGVSDQHTDDRARDNMSVYIWLNIPYSRQ